MRMQVHAVLCAVVKVVACTMARKCRALTGDIAFAAPGRLAQALRVETLGLAALLARHARPALARHAAALTASPLAAGAKAWMLCELAAVGHSSSADLAGPMQAGHAGHMAGSCAFTEAGGLDGGACPAQSHWYGYIVRAAAPWWQSMLMHEQSIASCAAIVTWLVPGWCALLAIKLVLGYSVRWLARQYNQYYDANFKRLFKSKQ